MNAIFTSILIVSSLTMIFGILIGLVNFYFKLENDPMIKKIHELLPQYNCGHCNYPTCFLYAESIMKKKEKIDKCIPGGDIIILELSKLLDVKKNVKINKPYYEIAFIEEKKCIGCTKCNVICPTDAIVGTQNTIHTVLKDECTGCKLCIAPCPTDCIKMIKIDFNRSI